jgi:hypothetical protein
MKAYTIFRGFARTFAAKYHYNSYFYVSLMRMAGECMSICNAVIYSRLDGCEKIETMNNGSHGLYPLVYRSCHPFTATLSSFASLRMTGEK